MLACFLFQRILRILLAEIITFLLGDIVDIFFNEYFIMLKILFKEMFSLILKKSSYNIFYTCKISIIVMLITKQAIIPVLVIGRDLIHGNFFYEFSECTPGNDFSKFKRMFIKFLW